MMFIGSSPRIDKTPARVHLLNELWLQDVVLGDEEDRMEAHVRRIFRPSRRKSHVYSFQSFSQIFQLNGMNGNKNQNL